MPYEGENLGTRLLIVLNPRRFFELDKDLPDFSVRLIFKNINLSFGEGKQRISRENSAGGGNRTHTRVAPNGILSPAHDSSIEPPGSDGVRPPAGSTLPGSGSRSPTRQEPFWQVSLRERRAVRRQSTLPLPDCLFSRAHGAHIHTPWIPIGRR